MTASTTPIISAEAQQRIVNLLAQRTRRHLTASVGGGDPPRRRATVPFIARYRKEATNNLDDASCAHWKNGFCSA